MSTPNASPSLTRQTEQLWCYYPRCSRPNLQTEQLWCYYLRCSRPNLCCDFCSRSCAFCKAEKEELLTLSITTNLFLPSSFLIGPKHQSHSQQGVPTMQAGWSTLTCTRQSSHHVILKCKCCCCYLFCLSKKKAQITIVYH